MSDNTDEIAALNAAFDKAGKTIAEQARKPREEYRTPVGQREQPKGERIRQYHRLRADPALMEAEHAELSQRWKVPQGKWSRRFVQALIDGHKEATKEIDNA